ncbi:MAG: glycosyl hydrolase [Candidatus Woesebacteria bacterium]|jgi:hypothetical protein
MDKKLKIKALKQSKKIKLGKILTKKIENKHLDKIFTSKFMVASFVITAMFLVTFGIFQWLSSHRQVLGESDIDDSALASQPANLVIDTGSVVGPLQRPWQDLSQGGEDKEWRLQPILSQVKTLKPKYIRIDHIYDFYEIVKGEPGNLEFDWTKFDLILDDILASGAKPYISLGYMPPVIADGDVVNKPKRWEDWQYTVQRSIEHISGTKKIKDVYYEVWNEPDHFGDWDYQGDKNYLELYTHAAKGAANAKGVEDFKFGGPATTGLYKSWFDALVKHARANNLRLDFFSWHRYSHSLEDFEEDMKKAQSWSKEYPDLQSSLELHITEWGHDSENHPGYDSYYGAAHTVATSIVMVNNIREALIFEIQDGENPDGQTKWGRWGIIDSENQAKPRFYALRMLNSLGDEELKLSGQNQYIKAIAAKDKGGKIVLIVVNFDPAVTHKEIVPITFINLDMGTYNLKYKFLNGKEIRQQILSANGRIGTQVDMRVNDVLLLELEKVN